jgi:hypothetical protein
MKTYPKHEYVQVALDSIISRYFLFVKVTEKKRGNFLNVFSYGHTVVRHTVFFCLIALQHDIDRVSSVYRRSF